MNDRNSNPYIFGPFRLFAGERRLSRDGAEVSLTPKEFDTLLTLVEAAGQVVSKEELINRVWPDSYVGDSSLARNVSVIRKALGEGVVETVPRRGYRLGIPVRVGEGSSEGSKANTTTAVEEVRESKSDPQAMALRHRSQGSAIWHGPSSRIVLYAAVIAVLAALVLMNRSPVSHAGVSAAQGPVRIAVLPYANYTGDPQKEYLCDGLTEATISELSRLKPDQLGVIARTSAMKFKNTDRTIPQIAAELNADYILESSVRGSGERMRITTQLVRGTDASHVWTGEYERSTQNLLDVQQQVSISVADEIRLSMDATVRKRIGEKLSLDSEAYQDYLLGRYQWNKRTRDGLLKSVEYFEKAIARDPNYAKAYAGLADSYLVLGGGYLPDVETYNKAGVAATKALELDNTLSDAYASLAYEKFVNERDMAAADTNYQQALMLDPNNANAHHWYALYLSAMKRPDEAITHIRRAMELDPLSIAVRYNAAWVYMAAGRDDDALSLANRALELDQNCAPAHGTLAVAFVTKGMYEQAIGEFQTAQKLRAEYSPYAVEVAHTYALEGKTAKARALLSSLLSDRHWGDVAPYSFAVTYAALGQKDDAFRWLKHCAEDHSCTANEFNNDHSLDSLRGDPRFGQITR